MGKLISGAGGGGGIAANAVNKAQEQRTPTVAGDSLDSRQYATIVDLISEGEIEGLKAGQQSIILNDTPLQNPDVLTTSKASPLRHATAHKISHTSALRLM
jgi:predicted phage tail protein